MPHPNEAVIVRHPEIGRPVVLDPSMDYDASDVMVKAYPWAFEPKDTTPGIVESVERATANPGEKRRARRASRA